MTEPEPEFQFLRSTPPDLLGNPPLASSLQSFETSLELLVLGRYPAALIACVNAWESALKAALKVPESERGSNLAKMLQQADSKLESTTAWCPASNRELRLKRNQMTHYGFTPRDSGTCADLLLRTGYPGLSVIYQDYFDYRLAWQQFGCSVKDFHNLSTTQMETVGLIPDWGDLLWLALDQYRKQQAKRKIDPVCYLTPFVAHLRYRMRVAWTSEAEYNAFEAYESHGGLFEEIETIKNQIQRHFDEAHVTCSCPICDAHEVLIIEVNDEAMEAGKVEAERAFCVGCHFQLPKEAGFLIQLLVGDELRDKWDALRADCGLI